ncbi:uncharacterized protein LOC123294240 [Chrysoperla carnea]|uniref:uncharacterized protein LOC123294240 n=1 Tax=Chrysoperla carnea TaxID=189513 RepID=UPI001D0781B1|nr:uncharacterized protein LOC123294240 [Chrysoperla carnea]
MTHLKILVILCQIIFTLNFINCAQPLLNDNAYNLFRQEILDYVVNTTSYNCTSATIKSAQQRENDAIVTSTVELDCDIKDEHCPTSRQLNCYSSFTYSDIESAYVPDFETFNCTPLLIPEFANCQVGQPGCPFDLNVNANGVQTFTNAALAHLKYELFEEYTLKQTLRLQRQVLETQRSGVKYYLTIAVAKSSAPSETEDDTICYVTFLEKPKLDTNARHIIANNCTYNQEYLAILTPTAEKFNQDHRNDQNNEIDVNYSVQKIEQLSQTKTNPNYEQIAQGGNVDDTYEGITASRVREIESQILPKQPSHDKKHAIDGLLDVFHFDAEPKLKQSQQSKVDAEFKPTDEELKPIIEPIIVPVKAVVAFHKPLQAPKIETVIIGVADDSTDESIQNTTENIEETQIRERRDLNAKSLQPTSPDEMILVENLSELAVDTLDNIDTDNHRRVVLKILGSKKSTNNGGITYHLTLKVGISECMEENEENSQTPQTDLLQKVQKTPLEQKCRNTLLSDLTMICKVQVYVTTQITKPKVVKSQCQNLKRNGERNNRTGGRYRRSVFTGGVTKLDTSDNDFYELVEDALKKLDELSDEPNSMKIINVKNATKQLVAGMSYKIVAEVGLADLPKANTISPSDRLNAKLLDEPKSRICTFNIWDRPWLKNGKEVSITCDDAVTKVSFRSKRSTAGGLAPLDTSDNEFYNLVEDGLKKLDELSDESNSIKIINVKNATKQVVAGMSYKIVAEVGLADLPKANKVSPNDRLNAKLLDEPKSKVCTFSIWDRPWIKNGKEISITCDDALTKVSFRSKRSIKKFGGFGDDHEIHLGLFHDYIQKFNKTYETKIEYKRRFNIFKQNMKKIKELNQYEQGTAKYGTTMFTDMTRKEFEQYLGYNPNLGNANNLPLPMADIPNIELPDAVDWRKEGAVTGVKNQGQCGSCWAFSVTGNVEGQYYLKNKKLLEFSEQELVDCDKLDDGCSGGLMDNAYRSIEKLGGLETESDYPYEARNDKCILNKSKVRVQLKGAVNITSDEVGMAKWLAKNGPISIAINANAMQFYMGGVSHPWKVLCNPKQLDHGVLIVGYGTTRNQFFNKTMPYWIVKNSWGKLWGEQGYYRIYRGGGTCGVNQYPSSAILADD